MDEEKYRQIAREEAERLLDENSTVNQFALSQTSFHTHNGIDSQKIQWKSLLNAPNYFCVTVNTNGTTAVDVFASTGVPYPLTVTGVFVISKDTTAGNITLSRRTDTVCTIAKGATAGALVGATSVSNNTYNKGDACKVVSSSAGNVTVFIAFIT